MLVSMENPFLVPFIYLNPVKFLKKSDKVLMPKPDFLKSSLFSKYSICCIIIKLWIFLPFFYARRNSWAWGPLLIQLCVTILALYREIGDTQEYLNAQITNDVVIVLVFSIMHYCNPPLIAGDTLLTLGDEHIMQHKDDVL